MSHASWIDLGTLALGISIGFFFGFVIFFKWPEEEDSEPEAIAALDLTHPVVADPEDEIEEEPVSQADGFAVTGTPRHVPWSRRKKELEASARQKRRRLEQFREDDNG